MPARNKAAAVRDGDRRPPPVAFDDGGDGGDLGGRVGVWVFRVRFQVGNLDELIVGAVDFHSGQRERKGSTRWNGELLLGQRLLRRVIGNVNIVQIEGDTCHRGRVWPGGDLPAVLDRLLFQG